MSAIKSLTGTVPELSFDVEGARSLEPSAVPTLSFSLRVDAPGVREVRSVLLDVQLQIAARQRDYSPAVQGRLLELFGEPERWGSTLRTLPWLRTTVVVPGFTGSTHVELPVTCTYDLEVTASRYFAALEDGEVPLELLFSGSVFFTTPEGALQAARIGWDREVDYRLPVATWRRMMDRHFSQTAWLRLGTDSFASLCAFKAAHAFATWDEAVDALLEDR